MAPSNSLTDHAFHYLRSAIINGDMTPGTWYSVYQIAEVLGISRTPVRDALLRLEEAGLVAFTRNRGFQVLESQPEDVAEIFGLRLCIEPPIAARAARLRTPDDIAMLRRTLDLMDDAAAADDAERFFHLDQELHTQIMRVGHSRRGVQFVDQLRANISMLGIVTAGSSRTVAEVAAEHVPLVDAISAANPHQAATAMRLHIATTGRAILMQLLSRCYPGEERPQLHSRYLEIWGRYGHEFLPPEG